MMRFYVVLISLVLTSQAAVGRPLVLPKPMPPNRVLLDLSSIHLHLFRPQSDADSGSSAPAAGGPKDWSNGSTLPSLAVGPLHAQFGSDDNPRANLSTYRLQGMDQLGSSVWEAEQGRSAKLLFVWPTDK